MQNSLFPTLTPQEKSWREPFFLGLGALALLGFLLLDISQPLGFFAGIPYVMVVACGMLAHSRRLILGFGIASIICIFIGLNYSPEGAALSQVMANRIFAMLAIVALVAASCALITRQLAVGSAFHDIAATDMLTATMSRRSLVAALETNICQARTSGKPLSMLLIDVDNFKSINDQYGHVVGDDVLQRISRYTQPRIEQVVHGRYGGEEFMVLCPAMDLEQAMQLAEKLRSQVQNMTPVPYFSDLKVTISVGVAELLPEYQSMSDFIDAADTALYTAKKQGRNCVISSQTAPKSRKIFSVA